MRLNHKKTKSVAVSWSRIYPPCYGDLILGAEFEKVRSLRFLGVAFDSKLMSEAYLHAFVSKAAKSLGVVTEQRIIH